MRVIALVVAGFLFFASLEAWAGYWLAGRWFIGSRFASVSLATIKSWLERGIVRPSTQTAKLILQTRGKWILLTLGLTEVIKEVERLQNTSEVCYLTTRDEGFDFTSCSIQRDGIYCYGVYSGAFTITSEDQRCLGVRGRVPAYPVYVWQGQFNRWQITPDVVPIPGRHYIGYTYEGSRRIDCYINVSVHIQPCPFAVRDANVPGHAPSLPNLDQERRRVPVRVFPNPSDFVRPDIIESDPLLNGCVMNIIGLPETRQFRGYQQMPSVVLNFQV